MSLNVMGRETFKKDYILGPYSVHVDIGDVCERSEGCVFFSAGLPAGLKSDNSAYFEEKDNSLLVRSDMFGLFRIYYWQSGDEIYLTDNVFKFISRGTPDLLALNANEKRYFDKHGYTSGDVTFADSIKKLPPSSELEVSAGGIALSSYYPYIEIENTPDEAAYREYVRKTIVESFSPLRDCPDKVILCYSGGTDSQYLAEVLLEMGIPFEAAFFADRTSRFNRKDMERARRGALAMGKQLIVADVTGRKEESTEKEISERMYFDRHSARLHFYGVKELTEIFGTKLVLINGQNSDSILSYGPSEEKYTSFLKRYLIYGTDMRRKARIARMISTAFRVKLKVPATPEERACAFYDNFRNCLLCDTGEAADYRRYVAGKVENIEEGLDIRSERPLFMYLKIFTYVQGSDSQVVMQSARAFGAKLIMPFSSSGIVYAALKYKDDIIELRYPKYVLRAKQ